MKYGYKHAIIIFITGITFLSLSFLILYQINYHNIVDSYLIHSKNISDEISNSLENQIKEKIKIVKTITASPVLLNALQKSNEYCFDLTEQVRKNEIQSQNKKWKNIKDPDNPFILEYTNNRVSQYLKKQQDILKDEYGEIFLTNSFGKLVGSTAKLSTFVHNHKYWWKGAYKKGSGSIFIDDRGYDESAKGYVLGIVVPIKSDNKIIGIIKANLNILGSINKLLLSQYSHTEKIQLIRSCGLIVFEENSEPLSKRIPPKLLAKLQPDISSSFIFNDQDKDWIISSSKIKISSGMKGYRFGGNCESIDHKKGNIKEFWYILTYNSISDIIKTSKNNFKSFIFIGLFLSIILALSSLMIGRGIAKPIKKLILHTKQISEGNFDQRDFKDRNDELGLLTISFNKMSQNLRNTTTSIENLQIEINERKKAEKNLIQSKDEYKSLFDNMSNGFALHEMIFDDDGTPIDYVFLNINKAFEEQTGLKKNYLIGKKVREVLPEIENDKVDWIGIYGQVVLSGNSINFENYSKQINKWYSIIAYRPDKDQFAVIIQDITDRKLLDEEKKKMQEKIQQSQHIEAIGSLAGGIAHQFNNSLTGIIGNIELLEMEGSKNESISRYTKKMKDSSFQMSKLANQLLAYARGGKYQEKIISGAELIKDTLPLITHTVHQNIRIEKEISKDICFIKVDITQMQMVLNAIMTNASEAIEDEGHISIICKNEVISAMEIEKDQNLKIGKYVKIMIKDDGHGMDPETKSRVFEPFFTTKFTGRGLGMAAAFGIVNNHNGTIIIDSIAGNGTSVSIYLPAVDLPQEVHESKKTEVSKLKENATIFVIEDEDIVREMIIAQLESLDHRVLSAGSGKEAIDLIKSFDGNIDLAILDMVLPDMGGKEIYKQIMEARPGLKVIVCSGYSIDGPAREVLENGAEDFIQKPFRVAELSEKLNKILK